MPELNGLTNDSINECNIISVESTGGFVRFTVDLNNGREGESNVEFWMTAVGPDGLIIPGHSREKWMIIAGNTFSKVRGINFDKSYPAGEYTINAQVVDIVSGERVEKSMTVVKK